MTMIRHLIALSTVAIAFGAQAQEATRFAQDLPLSTKTRAEVLAEVQAARRSGLLMAGNEGPDAIRTPVHSVLSREEVREAAIAASQRTPAQRWAERLIIGM